MSKNGICKRGVGRSSNHSHRYHCHDFTCVSTERQKAENLTWVGCHQGLHEPSFLHCRSCAKYDTYWQFEKTVLDPAGLGFHLIQSDTGALRIKQETER